MVFQQRWKGTAEMRKKTQKKKWQKEQTACLRGQFQRKRSTEKRGKEEKKDHEEAEAKK